MANAGKALFPHCQAWLDCCSSKSSIVPHPAKAKDLNRTEFFSFCLLPPKRLLSRASFSQMAHQHPFSTDSLVGGRDQTPDRNPFSSGQCQALRSFLHFLFTLQATAWPLHRHNNTDCRFSNQTWRQEDASAPP